MLNNWTPPLVRSSAGASHRRRGQPCQDASLVAELAGADGTALCLMAVADGHGAAAYRHSAVGSAAACRAAREAVAEALVQPGGEWRRPDPGALERWLGRELPAAIRRRWLAAIRRHWLGLAEGATAPFQPRPYGTTLGLVLMTPGWWACTGLGDWDLVRIDADGARLLSQEEGEGCGGEATASLAAGGCGDEGAGDGGRAGGAPFPFRWRWFALEPDGAPFALVLCTDGIRKSCASDTDFLALASWLATGMAVPALEDSLERISREGCGDDVSVAIVCWGEIGVAPPRQAAAHHLPTAGGPQASGGAAGGVDPARGGADLSPCVVAPAPGRGGRDGDRLLVAAVAPGSENGSLPVGAPPAEERAGSGRPGGRGARGGSPRPGRPAGRGMVAGLAVLAGLAAVGASFGLRLPQRLLPAGGDPLAQEVGRLCASPGLAAAALVSRSSQFEGLRLGRLRRSDLLAQRQRDPLGALIASTFPPQPLTGPGSPSAAATVAPSAMATGTASVARLAAPGRPCPALNQALDSLWGRSGAVPPTGPGAAGAELSHQVLRPPSPRSPGLGGRDSSAAISTPAAVPTASPAGEEGGTAAAGGTAARQEAGGTTARQEAAIRAVTALYGALARGDGASAAAYLGTGAADQFAPILFRPFARVELEELRPIDLPSKPSGQPPAAASGQGKASSPELRPDQDGGAVILEGVVRLVDRDGRIQRESRSFRVEQEGGVVRVTASSFGAVLGPDQ